MLWRRSAPAQTLPAPGPVPDVHAIRQLRLQASWQRDRWVARRRVALRWTLWYARRYVLPGALLVAVVVWGGLWLMPRWLAPAPSPAPLPVATPASVPAPSQENPGNLPEPALQLRLQSQLPAARASAPSSAAAAPQTDKFQTPKLTPDNWLHSKEP